MHTKNRQNKQSVFEELNAFSEINEFDFDYRKCLPGYYKLIDTASNSLEENKKVMLNGLQFLCMSCRLCPIGCDLVEKGENKYDPHVFSNMNFKSKFMIVGQNPGFNECVRGYPFVGEAGRTFDKELEKNGIGRNDFYISNVVKCFTKKADGTNNRKPYQKEKDTCASVFLTNEIRVLKPIMIITLGESAFSFFCPDKIYKEQLGHITKSNLGKIYAIYHPSGMNLSVPSRKKAFEHQIKMLSKIMKSKDNI